ncbi:hypothetical protein FQA39_LY17422 [Lamprigera yunnana]|nr:hypothetical protein FQA39_LY17422 [Lamprigera yunnana]
MLRSKWESLKKTNKKEYAKYKPSFYKTGGGSPEINIPLNSISIKVLAIIGIGASGRPTQFDSDSGIHFLYINIVNTPVYSCESFKNLIYACVIVTVDANKENFPTLFQRNLNTAVKSPTAVVQKRPKMSSKENENPASQSTIEISRPSTSSVLTEAENLHLKDVINTLQKILEAVSFSYETLLNNDSLISMYTGFPSGEIFDVVFNYLNKVKINYFNGWTVDKISKRDRILMTLMKPRLHLFT